MNKILVFLLFVTVETFSQPVTLNRVMQPGDPNLNGSWDWTVNSTYTIYYTTRYTGIQSQSVSLPFYSSIGPAAADLNTGTNVGTYARDIQKSNGWELFTRDFGTAQSAPTIPYFALYNRYKGIIRFFFFNTFEQQYTYSQLTATQPSALRTAIFTLQDDNGSFINNYDSQKSQMFVGRIEPLVWCYADFNVGGYDLSVTSKNDVTLSFGIGGTTQSELKLEGSLNLTQRRGVLSGDKPKAGGQRVIDYVNNAAGLYMKSSTSFKSVNDEIDDWKNRVNTVDGRDKDKWWASTIRDAINPVAFPGNVIKFLPAVGAIAGVVNFFSGGSQSNSSTPQYLDSGTIKLTGEITTPVAIASVKIRMPGSPKSDPMDNTIPLPLYPAPLGVFNVVNKPIVQYCGVYVGTSYSKYPSMQPGFFWYKRNDFVSLYYSLKEPLQIETNSNSGLTLVSTKTSFVRQGLPNETQYLEQNNLTSVKFISSGLNNVNLSTWGDHSATDPWFFLPPANYVNDVEYPWNPNPSFIYLYGQFLGDGNGDEYVPQIALELKFVKNNDVNDTVYFLKTYPVTLEYNTSIFQGKTSVIPPQNFKVAAYNNSPKLTWTVGNAISSYQIWKRVTNRFGTAWGSYALLTTVPGTTNSYVDNQITNAGGGSQIAEYKVCAVNSNSEQSPFTEPKQIYYGMTFGDKRQGTADNVINIPDKFALDQNFPNPFNPTTTIAYQVPMATDVKITIYDQLGREVSSLVNSRHRPGYYSVKFDAGKFASGIYFYSIRSHNFSETKRMLLVK